MRISAIFLERVTTKLFIEIGGTQEIITQGITRRRHNTGATVCMFYFISLYYEFRSQFACDNKRFNVETFYENKKFKETMIKDASDLFLSLTIKLLKKTAKEANKSGNINNWVRGSAFQDRFAAALDSELSTEMELEEKYNTFVAKYMTDIA